MEGRQARCQQTEVSGRQGLLGVLSARGSEPGAASRWCGQGPAPWASEGSPVGWERGAGLWLASSDRSVGRSGRLTTGPSPGSGSGGGGAHGGSRALAVKPGPHGPRAGTASRSTGTGPGVRKGRAVGRGGLLVTRGDSAETTEKRGPKEDPRARGAPETQPTGTSDLRASRQSRRLNLIAASELLTLQYLRLDKRGGLGSPEITRGDRDAAGRAWRLPALHCPAVPVSEASAVNSRCPWNVTCVAGTRPLSAVGQLSRGQFQAQSHPRGLSETRVLPSSQASGYQTRK